MYRSIVTHSDLDGLGSAALCSWAYGVNRIVFTGPAEVQASRLPITADDIVCDLPYPAECGLWFDHHKGNLVDVTHRGIDPASIPGRFAPEKSCGRVVLDHLLAQGRAVPPHFGPLADALDQVDSCDYGTVEEWRACTPAHAVANAMRVPFPEARLRNQFFRNLVFHLRDFGLEKTARLSQVRRYQEEYLAQEGRMLDLLRQDARPWEGDPKVVVVDLTRHNQKPFVWKNLAQVLFPEARTILSVETSFRQGRKTNDLAFSMAHTIRQNRSGEGGDVGEVLRELNIGDGHSGAGSGRVSCRSKDEMLRTKGEVLRNIVNLWRAQRKEECP